MQLGWKMHTFPLLADIRHFMDLSRTLTATPLATPQAMLPSAATSQGLRSGIIDRLPSSMQIRPPVAELQLDPVPFSMFSMAVNQAVAMKKICTVLQDTVGKLLDTFPSGWRKVCRRSQTSFLL